MGEETIKTVLKNAGLTEKESIVYISLAKNEPLEGAEIAKLTKKDKAQVFRIIKNLQAKGFVESTLDYPARYTVTPFENILENVVKSKREEITSIEKAKGQLVHYLKKKNQIEPSLEKFVIIKGNRKIYSRISKIFKETKNQLSVAMTFRNFVMADRLGVFDFAFKAPRRAQLKYRFLTEVNKENLNFIKALLDRMPKSMFSFKATNPDLAFTLFPRMIVRDNEEILFFTSAPSVEKSKDEVGLWTNSKSLVQAFSTVFEDLWRNSTDLQDRISEIELGKSTPKTRLFCNSDEAKKKYDETLHCAEKEIVLMTSSKSLNEYLFREYLEEWFSKGISVRIMTPVTSRNLETVKKISKFCKVKHVSAGFQKQQ